MNSSNFTDKFYPVNYAFNPELYILEYILQGLS